MGKLERAKIYVLEGDGKNTGARAEPKEGIDVCFNPKEYSLDKNVPWNESKAFTDAPEPEFTQPSPMRLQVTLHFDTYEERTSVRDKYVKKIEKLTLMRVPPGQDVKVNKKEFSPPVIVFVWGRFTFKGVIETLSQKYTMFLADGTPVRAECALKIRNVIDTNYEDAAFKPAGGGAQAQSYTIKEGDRLDSIAANQLGDSSRWPEIASANNIDDPVRDVKPGTPLKIPR